MFEVSGNLFAPILEICLLFYRDGCVCKYVYLSLETSVLTRLSRLPPPRPPPPPPPPLLLDLPFLWLPE